MSHANHDPLVESDAALFLAALGPGDPVGVAAEFTIFEVEPGAARGLKDLGRPEVVVTRVATNSAACF